MTTPIKVVAVKLPVDVVNRIEAVCERRYANRSAVVRELIIDALTAEELRLLKLDAKTKADFAAIETSSVQEEA